MEQRKKLIHFMLRPCFDAVAVQCPYLGDTENRLICTKDTAGRKFLLLTACGGPAGSQSRSKVYSRFAVVHLSAYKSYNKVIYYIYYNI